MRCTNYCICRISIFPELSDIHISRSIEILETWKYANVKIVEILKPKIMYVSKLKCMSYVCMHACMQSCKFVDKHVCLYVCMY